MSSDVLRSHPVSFGVRGDWWLLLTQAIAQCLRELTRTHPERRRMRFIEESTPRIRPGRAPSYECVQ